MARFYRRRKRSNAAEAAQQALERAVNSSSEENDRLVIAAFRERGLPEQEIRPRENVLTFTAWKAKGRVVKRGEKGVAVPTLVEYQDEASGQPKKVWSNAWVFHESQTCELGGQQQAAGAANDASRDVRTADWLEDTADRLEDRIRKLEEPMTQRWTSRRGMYDSDKKHDAANLRNVQQAMRALAAAHRAGCCPPELRHLRFEKQIGTLVRWAAKQKPSGYYHLTVTQFGVFADDSPLGKQLQQFAFGEQSQQQQEQQEELARKAKIREAEDRFRTANIPDFFPTPGMLAARMARLADLQPGHEVLEPSAGLGHLAEAIKARCPEAEVICVEQNYELCEVLSLKGFNVIRGDFLDLEGEVDRVVMNPPFSKQQDEQHFRHAVKLLKPGGRIIGIITDRAFRTLFDELSGDDGQLSMFERLENAFAGSDAFRNTNVQAVLVLYQCHRGNAQKGGAA